MGGGTEEKMKFMYRMFDLDGDGNVDKVASHRNYLAFSSSFLSHSVAFSNITTMHNVGIMPIHHRDSVFIF